MGKKISFTLDPVSIDRAIKELKDYKRDIQRKMNLLRERVAERIKAEAQSGFDGAIVDDLTPRSGGVKMAQVSVTTSEKENVMIVLASGEDAIWVEFGAGVFHNAPAGASPHPKSGEFGFTIGGFGKGYGNRELWGYYDEDGSLRLTHGTPAAMPMYKALQSVIRDIPKIAIEVFA